MLSVYYKNFGKLDKAILLIEKAVESRNGNTDKDKFAEMLFYYGNLLTNFITKGNSYTFFLENGDVRATVNGHLTAENYLMLY